LALSVSTGPMHRSRRGELCSSDCKSVWKALDFHSVAATYWVGAGDWFGDEPTLSPEIPSPRSIPIQGLTFLRDQPDLCKAKDQPDLCKAKDHPPPPRSP
jgi:hypothetical protein